MPYETKYWNEGIIINNPYGADAAVVKVRRAPFLPRSPLRFLTPSQVEYHADSSSISVAARAQGKGDVPAVLFSQVVELMDAVLANSFKVTARTKFPCPLCVSGLVAQPTLFERKDIEARFRSLSICSLHQTAAAQGTLNIECERDPEHPHLFPLYRIAPDIAMIDFDSQRIDVKQAVRSLDHFPFLNVSDRPRCRGW